MRTEIRPIKPMKILMYGKDFLPTVGGVQKTISRLARGLIELGAGRMGVGSARIEVTVATRTSANGMDDSSLAYRVVRQPGFWHLVRLIRDAEVIHVLGPCFLPMGISWMIRKPFVVSHHGYQSSCPNGLLFYEPTQSQCPGHFMAGRYTKCLACTSPVAGRFASLRLIALMFPRRWLCKRAAVNIVVSNHLAARIQLPRIRTIYHGVDLSPSISAPVPNPSDTLRVAYVGRLVAEKGLTVLLQAAQMLDRERLPFYLTIVGDGPERNRLESMVDSFALRSRVNFTGSLEGGALEGVLGRTSVVVMPTIMEETAGWAVIEQMMRGGIAVVSDIGGLSEMVGDAGLKFPPGDSAALASCIGRLIQDDSVARSLGAAARTRAIRVFNKVESVRNYYSAYQEALGRRE